MQNANTMLETETGTALLILHLSFLSGLVL